MFQKEFSDFFLNFLKFLEFKFNFIIAPVTGQHVERPIARLNCDRQSSLKVGGYVAQIYSPANHFKMI